MTITQDELKDKIRTRLKDPNGLKWTDDELTEAVDDAMFDPVFSVIVEDSSLPVVSGQIDYTIDDSLDVVSEIFLDNGVTKLRLPRSNWEQIDTKIRFSLPPDSGTLLMVGLKQITDYIAEEKVNLAIYLTMVSLYEMLLHKYSNGILMSDITGAEILQMMSMFETKAQKERSRLRRVTNTRGYRL